MNKYKLNVPERLEFLSDWKELDDLFNKESHLILNKKITGCGATSYFLNHPSMKVILCSPRLLLLEDKFNQSKKYTHWFRNGDNFEEDSGEQSTLVNKKNQSLKDYTDDLTRYLINVDIPKILVTYDSLKYVLDTLKYNEENLDEYIIVVDEFHSIFQDCKFKPSVELDFLKVLKSMKRVVYLSATPILDEYLEQMDEFKDLPYYELVWPENRLIKATINKIKVDNLIDEAINIINIFKGGLFPTKIIEDNIVESKEAVFYFNSVKDIVDILKKTKLSLNEVNILCAKTADNKKRLKKIDENRKYIIGSIPKKGEPHKMFTFCTRTSFLGTDFYSNNASTYIFADPNIDSLSIDISMDLPQILGRQRLAENPFRYEVTLFYKTINILDDVTEFENKINSKIISTNMLINMISSTKGEERKLLIDRFIDSNITNKYSKDYLGFINNTDVSFNKLVYFSDLRSWKIQQMNFKDGYTLLNTLKNEGFIVKDKNIEENEYTNFYKAFTKTKSFETKMKLYCEMVEKVGINQVKLCSFISSEYHNIFDKIGLERIKALKYRKGDIENYIKIKKSEKVLYTSLKNEFKIGDRISKSLIKEKLREIYNNLNIDITPKATDLNKFFEIRRIKLPPNIAGFEIVSHTHPEIIKKECSIFNRVFNTKDSQLLNISDILKLIKIGTPELISIINEIRTEENHQKQNDLKYLNLPIVCWNGVFEKRNNNYIKEYSSYLALDIDNLKEMDVIKYKNLLKQYEFIKAIFVTPSGKGLKVIVQHDNINPKLHKELFIQISKIFNIEKLDMGVSDLARGNYLSHDPNIYINEKCKSYHFTEEYIYNSIIENHKYTEYKSSNNSLEDNRILGCLDSYWHKKYPESWEEGNRHNAVLKQASKLNKVGIEKDRALSYLIVSFETLSEHEILNIVNYIYQSNPSDFGIDRESFNL